MMHSAVMVEMTRLMAFSHTKNRNIKNISNATKKAMTPDMNI